MATVPETAAAGYGQEGRPRRRAAFLKLTILAGAGALVALFFLAAPRTESRASDAAPQDAPDSNQDASAEATPTPVGPQTNEVVNLYTGPSTDYPVVATFPKGWSLEVVGQNDDGGGWLAVRLGPGSSLYVWLPSEQVRNPPDGEGLAVKPVIPLPTP